MQLDVPMLYTEDAYDSRNRGYFQHDERLPQTHVVERAEGVHASEHPCVRLAGEPDRLLAADDHRTQRKFARISVNPAVGGSVHHQQEAGGGDERGGGA